MKSANNSSNSKYESPLRRALNKAQDVNVEAGINFLNTAIRQAAESQESPLENLRAFRDHLDKRIAELESNEFAEEMVERLIAEPDGTPRDKAEKC